MCDLNIKVLTVPKHLYRNYMLIGHLETMDFPVGPWIQQDRLKFCNGFDYNDYETKIDLIQAMIDDGWAFWAEVLQRDDCDIPRKQVIAIEWGFLNILKKIVEEDAPALVLESDVKFHSLTYDDLMFQWKILLRCVGYNGIKIAQLAHFPREDAPESTASPMTDFWARGAGGRGQYANIITPHGAEFMMSRGKPTCTLENYLARYPETDGFFSARETQYRYGNIASALYPYRYQGWDEDYGSKIQGDPL